MTRTPSSNEESRGEGSRPPTASTSSATMTASTSATSNNPFSSTSESFEELLASHDPSDLGYTSGQLSGKASQHNGAVGAQGTGAAAGPGVAPWIWSMGAPARQGAATWATHFDDFSAAAQEDCQHGSSAASGITLGSPPSAMQHGLNGDGHLDQPLFTAAGFPASGLTNFDALWEQAAQHEDFTPFVPHTQRASSSSADAARSSGAKGPLPIPGMTPFHGEAPASVSTQAFERHPHFYPRASLAGSEEVDELAILEDEEVDDAPYDRASKKPKLQRRQGVTCDACRSKHLRCDLLERRVNHGLSPNPENGNMNGVKCTRCTDKDLNCTKNHAPPSRRYPRPSRTGKRIEQARLLHGSIANAEASRTSPLVLAIEPHTLASANRGESKLASSVMASSVSLRLLTCFFATAHIQLPLVDLAHFSFRYNWARGDPRVMSIMSNGGSQEESIPSAPLVTPGLRLKIWPETGESTISTPATAQALMAAMHAWAACYTDLPLAFGSQAQSLGFHSPDNGGIPSSGISGIGGVGLQHTHQLGGDDGQSVPCFVPGEESAQGASNSLDASPSDRNRTTPPEEVVSAKTAMGAPETAVLPGGRRPKRKQGVACDTCRLRRVRCDVTERAPGMGCSRCEDKRIICTQEYINTKRKSTVQGTEVSGSTPNTSAGKQSASESSSPQWRDQSELGPDSWKDRGKGEENRVWVEGRPEATAKYAAGRAKELLRFGQARRAFCQEMLSKAIEMVHKHDLLRKPSVETIQCLLILAQVVDRADPASSPLFTNAAARHLTALNLEQPCEVHEQDQAAVEGLIMRMQSTRVYCSAWTYSSLVSMLSRATPHYKADRAIGIQGGASASSAARSGVETPSPPGGMQLSGEMGMSFCLLALVQIGALARFVTKHIDSPLPTGSSLVIGPQERFGKRMTAADVHRLQKACNALWNSQQSLLLFFDRCTDAARAQMDRLTGFQPLTWIATIKVAAGMLDLAVYRILGERFHVQNAYVAAMSQAFPGASTSEDAGHAAALGHLLHRARERTLLSCRSIAHLVEFLLPKRVFQTGGTIFSSFSAVAQFLIRTPPTTTADVGTEGLDEDSCHADATASATSAHVDPRQLSGDARALSPSHFDAADGSTGMSSEAKLVSQIAVSKTEQLGPYDAAAKAREVGAVLEGLAQLGYAFDLSEQVASLEHLLVITQQQELQSQQQHLKHLAEQQQHLDLSTAFHA
ncbi:UNCHARACTERIZED TRANSCRIPTIONAL REGULATORY PROTEIN [Ceraceosorus bombacis]|uniref:UNCHARACTERIZED TRANSCRIPTIONAL REGULATORY PROTEIN n=1 Tax=Ceraceosorus bombacis TaxID=401625 RepID=A0A0P1BEX0_9BASI|nr:UNCHARACTERIZED TRANSCRIPTIONAL REGULATORY PROTEIN [Ceraceosorus bombacis]